MSDVWQGPGWWLAPDGKWYPADGGPADVVAEDAPAADAPPAPVERTPDAPSAAEDQPPPAGPPTGPDAPSAAEDQPPPTGPPTGPDAPSAAVGTEPRGGWTAVEPDEPVETPSLTDEAQWAPSAVDEATTAAPALDADTAPVRPDAPAPIERDEAWRKPGETAAVGYSPTTGAPEVVDLTEPSEPVAPPESFEPPSPWRGVLLALGFLAAIIGLAVIVGLIFINFVLDDDESDVSTGSSTTTQQSAPSTESTTTTTADPADGVVVPVSDITTGDCIKDDVDTGEVETIVVVDCSVEHRYEVYTEEKLGSSITEFDEEAINVAAEEICRDAFEAYIPADDERDIRFIWFQPTADSWVQTEPEPDRTITCLLYDNDGLMTGRAA